MIWKVWNEWFLCITELIQLNIAINLPFWGRNFSFSTSYVDILSIHNIDNLSVPNIDINVLSIPNVDNCPYDIYTRTFCLYEV